MKCFFDLSMSLLAIIFLSIPMLITALLVKLTSPGPILYWSDRVGRNNTIFKMPKFRTMRTDTPSVATHLLGNPDQWLTPVGKFLRKSSLDELPQLFSILNVCHPRMPLSGIQSFQPVRIWIPDQKRFGNDSYGVLQEPQ